MKSKQRGKKFEECWLFWNSRLPVTGMVPELMMKGWLEVTDSGHRYSFHHDLCQRAQTLSLSTKWNQYLWVVQLLSMVSLLMQPAWECHDECSVITELSVSENALELLSPNGTYVLCVHFWAPEMWLVQTERCYTCKVHSRFWRLGTKKECKVMQ